MRASRSSPGLGSGSNEIAASPRSEAATKQLADRRVDDVEADVDEAEGRGCLAEAAVEIGGDGHVVILLRMRRTPVDAACRAASGLEPSADAIWSYERS